MPSYSPLYILGHSHGVSQCIRLLQSLQSSSMLSRVKGAIFIAGGLKDGPSELTNEGGHWIFRFLPMFMLKQMQPKLSEDFVEAAIHPSNSNLKDSALEISNGNDMAMCKAFYRQQKYVSSKDALSLTVSCTFSLSLIRVSFKLIGSCYFTTQTRAIIIHGRDDMILPLAVGQHLHQSLTNSEINVIPNASHQVFEEEPMKVALLMLDFMK